MILNQEILTFVFLENAFFIETWARAGKQPENLKKGR